MGAQRCLVRPDFRPRDVRELSMLRVPSSGENPRECKCGRKGVYEQERFCKGVIM